MHTPTVAYRRAVRPTTSLGSSALWITDDLLTTAYHRWVNVCQTTKRFANNAPGPLEAQRRLAKRKLGGLSTIGGSAAVDIGPLFGNGPPARHELCWEAPWKMPGEFTFEGMS